MIRILYSRWDGLQKNFSLEGEEALDELSRYLMEGLDVEQALDWMRYQGFDLAGMDFRVMGLEELLNELRQQVRDLLSRYNMDHSFDEHRERLQDILDREEAALRDQHGVESARWNDFRGRRDSMPRRLSEALERFRDHEWADGEAEADFQELLDSLDDVRSLEEFYGRNRSNLQGPESLDFEEALELMRQAQALSDLARNLLEGNFEQISPDELRELMGDEAAQSFLILRDLESALERSGYLRQGQDGLELTPRAIRRIGELALEDIYSQVSRGTPGSHETPYKGAGLVSTERTTRYHFGGPSHLDAIGTLRNALQRAEPPAAGAAAATRRGIQIEPRDLQVFDNDQMTEVTTVLLLDMSWSMSWSGRWPAAKRVAIALDHLIRTRFPRDFFFTVGFYTRARQLHIRELPELSWNMSDPFTNLQDGLRVAERLIDRHPSSNPQIIVVTDGQPTAYFVGDELRVEWPNGFGGTSPRANRETLREVRRITRKGITINTFMLDDSQELMRFVEAMTRINKGRAFYTTPGQLGDYIMVDYLSRKRRRIG
jgi:uncharacterized protein with von Willebrand factor type A (vWA) domain